MSPLASHVNSINRLLTSEETSFSVTMSLRDGIKKAKSNLKLSLASVWVDSCLSPSSSSLKALTSLESSHERFKPFFSLDVSLENRYRSPICPTFTQTSEGKVTRKVLLLVVKFFLFFIFFSPPRSEAFRWQKD